MGEALLAGILRGGISPDAVGVVEPLAARRDELTQRFSVRTSESLLDGDGVVLAVKPQHTIGVAAGVATKTPDRVLSIAAGVTLRSLEGAMPGVAVIRAMPNTPALVGVGAAAISGGAVAGDSDLAWAEQLLSSVGKVVRVPEQAMDAVTGLSGSGPAYVFMVAEALIEAGVLQGLPREVASTLTVQTLLGAATLLAESEKSATELRHDVTSPGGTTAAGLRALEDHGLRAALLDAVQQATERSRSLGA